ncbi:TPA: virulence protein [Streptococcus suis]|uniref:virulence protein n=1 Tax=Streptococcus suis TaxID=1307 RepID=UPI001ABE46F9|nr:virulence protein [Streptococcus suis]MBO4110264.1 virulence protein [Streptococcus suis]MDG3135101.1 virulence protein [Streptococcus suis]HEM3615027.1 virulence protein [Streptococcus suis]HEM3641767.1 virulence protein [Streptococcus suis]
MELNYSLKGEERKKLVHAIEHLTLEKAKYLGMPSAAYEVGEFIVSKKGTVTSKATKRLIWLKDALSKNLKEGKNSRAQGLTVAISRDKVDLANLKKILENKGDLIKKALEITNFTVYEDEGKVEFPWFDEVDKDRSISYKKFISSLCEFSKKAKRINDCKREVVNEKYAFRCFLLRLGFIGDEYKKDRKILLENLSGSSAFRNGGSKDEISK